jgi:VanZ family protein
MNLSRLWWWMGGVLVVIGVIVCLLPSRDLPESLELSDKVSHLVGHGALALYFTGLVPRRAWWKIFVFLLGLGIAIEFAQYFMHAGREGDPRDVVANSLGALLGLALGWLGLARWPELAARILGLGRAAP